MKQISVEDADTWRLAGDLTFATVGELLKEFTRYMTLPRVVDLDAVTHTDSAGLALLIEWVRQTKDTPIIFKNVPAQMLNLAVVSGVQAILSFPEQSQKL